MKINKIRLYNFSSYAGENIIDLQTSLDKNVILIGGNNGAGKTSLFTAIKLALYGPQSFKYQDKNHYYYSRIGELINHDAFLSDNVKSFVELEIYLPTERDNLIYTIHREWTINNQRIEELFYVLRDGAFVNEDDLDFFQNYLYSVVPPNLFDFFLFDGEEIGEFFSVGTYNHYVKRAILTLSGYDTFNIIEKFCNSFIVSEEDNIAYEKSAEVAREAEKEYAYIVERIAVLKKQIEDLQRNITEDENERSALENKFMRSGGITADERIKLEEELSNLDNIKNEKSRKIRAFVETIMPLFITRELAFNVYEQLKLERSVQEYKTVLSLISPEILSDIIKSLPIQIDSNEVLIKALSCGIAEHIKPDIDIANFQNIHCMSIDQENQVIAAITQLNNFESESLIIDCKQKEKAVKKYNKTAKKLRNTLPEIDASAYLAKISQVSKRIEEFKESLARSQVQLEIAQSDCEQQLALKERTRKALQVFSKNQTAFIYTEKISQIMNQMIKNVIQKKFRQIEQLTMKKFMSIISKENYVSLFELDESFNINLYKNQEYTIKELSAIVKHSGIDALAKRLGIKGVHKVLRILNLNSLSDLRQFLVHFNDALQISFLDDQMLELYNRIELNQLSRGEKQVFILSLYWAIIKTSNQSIPFIIDTPFARIDTEHRERIAELFFPVVSEQVVILSTDEEVVDNYYKILKSKISKEYLLDYNSESRKTVIKQGYFNEVAQ